MHMQTKESRGRCKIDFKSKTVTRNKEGHYIIKKRANLSRGYNNCEYRHIQH